MKEAARFKVILASTSPRRMELMSLICPDFDVCSPNIDERRMRGEKPDALAKRLARLKAETVFQVNPDAVVLGYDTVVALGNDVFGKPGSIDRAMYYLKALNGKVHQVHTGICVCSSEGHQSLVVSTDVEFGEFPVSILEAYARTSEGLDKAGAYAIQGKGAFLIHRINGSYTSVVGLPLYETALAFSKYGIKAFAG